MVETKVLVIEDNARYRHDLELSWLFWERTQSLHPPRIGQTSGKGYKGQL